MDSPFFSSDDEQLMEGGEAVRRRGGRESRLGNRGLRDEARYEDSDRSSGSEEIWRSRDKSSEPSDDGSDSKQRRDKKFTTRSSTSSKENCTPCSMGYKSNHERKPIPPLFRSVLPPEDAKVPRFMQRTTAWNLKKDPEKRKPQQQRQHKRAWISTAGPGKGKFESTVPMVVKKSSPKSSPEPWDDSEPPPESAELPRYMKGTVAVVSKLRDKSVFDSSRKPTSRNSTGSRPKPKEVHIISIPFY